MSDASMTTMVEYQIRAENTSMDAWLDEWEKRAEDALHGEPETSAYAAAINVEDETNVLVFERYEQGDRSLKFHMDRHAHTTLIETMGERRMTKRRVMSARYPDVPDYGWWSRHTTADPGREGAIIVILGLRFADDAKRAAFIELSSGHAAYCWESEPDTLIYSGGIAAADADRELDLKAGDLVFVMHQHGRGRQAFERSSAHRPGAEARRAGHCLGTEVHADVSNDRARVSLETLI